MMSGRKMSNECVSDNDRKKSMYMEGRMREVARMRQLAHVLVLVVRNEVALDGRRQSVV